MQNDWPLVCNIRPALPRNQARQINHLSWFESTSCNLFPRRWQYSRVLRCMLCLCCCWFGYHCRRRRLSPIHGLQITHWIAMILICIFAVTEKVDDVQHGVVLQSCTRPIARQGNVTRGFKEPACSRYRASAYKHNHCIVSDSQESANTVYVYYSSHLILSFFFGLLLRAWLGFLLFYYLHQHRAHLHLSHRLGDCAMPAGRLSVVRMFQRRRNVK